MKIQLPLGSGRSLLSGSRGAGENAKYFFLAHDDEVFSINLDFGAGILAEKDAVAFFYVDGAKLAFLADLAFAGGDDFSLHRFIFRGVGDNDPAAGGIGFLYPTDQNAVMQRGEF